MPCTALPTPGLPLPCPGNLPPPLQGSENVPTGRGLEKFGDGCLFITYSLLISGLGSRKAKKEAAEAGGPSVEHNRIP